MLTDLENTVLGVIALDEPVTAYAVRTVFARSLSSHWSSSAGSIYPVIRRLARRKLVRAASRRGDGRGAKLFSITAAGKTALKAWLLPPLPGGAALMPNDPLRVRVRFLAMFGRRNAVRMLRDARAQLATQLARIAEQLSDPETTDSLVRAVHRGAQLSIRAQIKWINELVEDADQIFEAQRMTTRAKPS